MYGQQAAYTTEEAAVCSRCTLSLLGEKSTVGSTSYKSCLFFVVNILSFDLVEFPHLK